MTCLKISCIEHNFVDERDRERTFKTTCLTSQNTSKQFRSLISLFCAHLQQLPVHGDGDPVVGGEGDGEEGRRHEAEYGGEGQRYCATEAHHCCLISLCSLDVDRLTLLSLTLLHPNWSQGPQVAVAGGAALLLTAHLMVRATL